MKAAKVLSSLLAAGLLALAAPMLAQAKTTTSPAGTAAANYYAGNVSQALQQAANSGDRWIAGLSAYRLGYYSQAEQAFRSLSGDSKQTSDLRAAGAYWAARAAARQYDSATAESMLQLAARWPATFYGMIGQRHLDSAIVARPQMDSTIFTFVTTGPDGDGGGGISTFTATVATSSDAGARLLPAPQLSALGGITIGHALVYALVKQESGFNPRAVSSAGAMGLMQLMPGTAAQTAKLSQVRVGSVLDEGTNLRLGQDYVNWLVNSGLPTTDMLCAVAAYNAGPGSVTKVADRVGGYGDSLMIMESMPAKETRDYVKKVMVNFWTYQRQFGSQTTTLDALAAGYGQIDIFANGDT